MDMVDVLVIGAGPAGLNAALYAARKELSVKVVTTDMGGQMLLTNEIENYLGFPSISGFELADKMEAHVKQYPVEFVYAGVKSLVKEADGTFTAHLDDGSELHGKTCIVTAGKHSRTLDIPGEKEYTGRGVSYCATCDAPFYRKKTVAVVGGGDSAVQAAIELAKLCPTVYLLVRSRIRAQEILVKRMKELDHVKVYVGYTPEVVKGEKKVNALIIKNKADGSMEELTVDGVFVEAGGIPNNSFLPSDVKVNSLGEIMTNKDGETNVEGLFAAGDVTDCRNKQVIIAAGEGGGSCAGSP